MQTTVTVNWDDIKESTLKSFNLVRGHILARSKT